MQMERGGRRVSAGGAKRKAACTGKREALTPRERARLLRLVASGAIFVLLVAVKLLLPGKLAGVEDRLAAALRRNVDVQAVFSAVGDLFTKDAGPEEAVDQLYRAVFRPEETEHRKTSSSLPPVTAPKETDDPEEKTDAEEAAPGEETDPPAGEDPAQEAAVMGLVLYSDEDMPDNVSLRQAILGFDHQTPVRGTLSSGFGYRDHPVEGTERFHYGVDLAAATGTDIGCFADGTVTAVGDSNSYGRYCTVAHANGCTTLYAHCSRISVSSGTAVAEGEKLGEVGETGMATGPHLHFELQKDGVYLDPIYYVETA